MKKEDTQDRRYRIESLTEIQAQTIVAALDLYARLGMGQFESIGELARFDGIPHKEERTVTQRIEAAEEAEAHLNEAKKVLTGMPRNASFGIGHPKVPRNAQRAFEIMKAVRHRIAWERNPEGGMGVHFDNPSMLNYTGEPLPGVVRDGRSMEDLLSSLPEDYLVTRKKGGWLVVKASQDKDDRFLDVVSQSDNLETAVLMARNAIENRPARSFKL